MKKLICLLLIAHCSLQVVNAQQPTEEWVRRYSDTSVNSYSGSSVKMDNSGNVYVLARTGNFGFLKYDQSGNLLLTASTPVPSGFENGSGKYFDVTETGDVYVTGEINISINTWIYTCKFDSQGSFLWGKVYNPDSGDLALDIKIDNIGNIILAGSSRIGSINYALIIKYNQNGDTLWVRKFNNSQNEAIIYKIVLDNINNIYATGYIGTPSKCLIMKYSSFGNQTWFSQFSFESGASHTGLGISLDLNENIYLILAVSVSFSGLNNYLLKLSNNGSMVWNRVFKGILNGEGRNTDIPKGPVISSDGNSIYFSTMSANGLGGGSYSVATVKYNSSGDSQWVRVYGGGGIPGANRVSNIKLDKLDNVYVCGSGHFQITGDDAVIVKYDPVGNQKWVTQYTGIITNGGDGTNDILIDTNLNVFSTGVSKKTDNNGIVAFTRKINQIVGINIGSNQVPKDYKLYQNYPNPFNPVTKIKFNISSSPGGGKQAVKLVVYDLLGREVNLLVDEQLSPGSYEVIFDGSNYTSGTYFYRLTADNKIIDAKKMVIVK